MGDTFNQMIILKLHLKHRSELNFYLETP